MQVGLRPGAEIIPNGWPNIWMSGEGAFVPVNEVYLTYDIAVQGAKEVPCSVISAGYFKWQICRRRAVS